MEILQELTSSGIVITVIVAALSFGLGYFVGGKYTKKD